MEHMNNNRLDQLFDQARKQEPKVSLEKTQQRFLKSSTGMTAMSGTQKAFLSTKGWVFTGITLAVVTGGVVILSNFFNNSSNNKEQVSEALPVIHDSILIEEEHLEVVSTYLEKVERLHPDLKIKKKVEEKLALKSIDKPQLQITVSEQPETKKAEKVKKEPVDTSYLFPALTPEETQANNKQKAKMLKQLVKFDKKKYAFIPSGSGSFYQKQVSVQAFYMQNTEVTNLEYRTFLFDLILQGRKEDFMLAKPYQKIWTKDYPSSYNGPMDEHYFSHAAYDDYPVVGITRKGAEMYCEWITIEVNKVYRKKGKAIVNDVRIPTDYEWMYAARGGKTHASPYPWGGPYVRNAKGCYIANFKPKKDNYNDDGAFHTAKADSYHPNEYGLFCLSGNVAEMVYYVDENNAPGTKGGSWTSPTNELQIEDKNDRFKGKIDASSNIGFRPVVTYLGKGKPLVGVLGNSRAQNPPGALQITENIYMDQTEITNISWKEYVSWIKGKHGKNSKAYKAALPDTTVWNNGLNAAYTKHYYHHPAYGDYPVVGISYEQAIAYCKWRTERVKEIFTLTNPNQSFKYRLPTKEEWEKVAKAGYSSINTKKDGDKHKFNLKRPKEDGMGVAGKLNDNADIIAPVHAYWPNDYRVYNIIGNVAEMTNKKGIAKGGSWKHTAEEASLTKEQTYTEPTNWLGFRCVFEIVD